MRLRSKLFTWALATGLLVIGPAVRANTIYECTMNEETTNRGWLPTVVYVAYDPDAEEVQVSDPMIQDINGGPLSV